MSRWRDDLNGDGKYETLKVLPKTPLGSPMLINGTQFPPTIVTVEAVRKKSDNTTQQILFVADFEWDLERGKREEFIKLIKEVIDLVNTIPESIQPRTVQVFKGTLLISGGGMEGYYSGHHNVLGIDVLNKNTHGILAVLYNESYHAVYHTKGYYNEIELYLNSLSSLGISFPYQNENIGNTYEAIPTSDGRDFELVQTPTAPYMQHGQYALADELIGDAGASIMILTQIGINQPHNESLPYSGPLNPDIGIYEENFRSLLERYWAEIENDLSSRGLAEVERNNALSSFIIAHLISIQPLLKGLPVEDVESLSIDNKDKLWRLNFEHANQFFIDKLRVVNPEKCDDILRVLNIQQQGNKIIYLARDSQSRGSRSKYEHIILPRQSSDSLRRAA